MAKRIAYVTGGMGGIGTAICQRLHKDGLTVVAGCGPNSPRRERWLAEQSAMGFTFIASEGNVADWESTGAAIAKVDVKARNLATNLELSTTTNNSGAYRFFNLPIGHYSVEFHVPGFQLEKHSPVQVQANRTSTENATLKIGSVSTAIEVTASNQLNQVDTTNGYVLGEEAGGAFFGGLRYGEGFLHTKNAGDLRVFWQGPSIGWDFGGDGARTMMLVYNLPRVDAIYQRFGGLSGSAYFVGGFGMTALTTSDMVVVPVRSGLGLRLGANLGYLKFTPQSTWNPF